MSAQDNPERLLAFMNAAIEAGAYDPNTETFVGGGGTTFSGTGTPNAKGAFALAGAATIPLTVVAGVNDTFIHTPIATGIPNTLTIAPGTYNSLQELQVALTTATGTVEGFNAIFYTYLFGWDQENMGSLYVYARATGTANNGDTLTSGPTDVLAELGFTSPVTLSGGQVGQVGAFGQSYKDTTTGAIFMQSNTGPDAIGWYCATGISDLLAWNPNGLFPHTNGDYSTAHWVVESGDSGAGYLNMNPDGSLVLPHSGGSIYAIRGVPTFTPRFGNNALCVDTTTGIWYHWNHPGWVAA